MSASNTRSSLQPNMHPWKGSTVRARSDWHRVGRVCQSSPVTCKDVFPTSGGTSWLTATWHWPLASSSDPLVSLPVSFQVSRVCRSLPGTSLKAKDDTAGSCRSSTRLLPKTIHLCEQVARAGQGLPVHSFDTISGLSGIGAYLLCRRDEDRPAATLDTVVRTLVHLLSASRTPSQEDS
jgi:hypothetical protein